MGDFGWVRYGSGAGLDVARKSALTYSAYFAALRAISEDVAKLPFNVYERVDDSRREMRTDSPAYRLIHNISAPGISAMSMRETLTAFAMHRGGGFAEIERTTTGRPIRLWPIHSDRVKIRRNDDSSLTYIVKMDNGQEVGIPGVDMLHIHGLGADGVTGYALSILGRAAIDSGLSAENFGNKFFEQGTRPSGALIHPGVLTAAARDNLRRGFRDRHAGSDNAGSVLILEEGAKWEQMSIAPEEAQFIETRAFQVEEVARWFRITPHKLQDLRFATYSNVAHQAIEYVQDTLMPWLVRWEQEVTEKLLSQEDYFASHVVDGLLRGDSAQRSQYYREMFAMGALSVNEIRGLENMNSIGSDGDKRFVPMNMMTLENAGEEPELETEPEPVLATEEDEEMNDEMRAALASMERRIADSEIAGRIGDAIDAKLAPLVLRLDRIEDAVKRVRDQVISENTGVDRLGASLAEIRAEIAAMMEATNATDDDASGPTDARAGAVCARPESDSEPSNAGDSDSDDDPLSVGTKTVEFSGDPGSDGYEPD